MVTRKTRMKILFSCPIHHFIILEEHIRELMASERPSPVFWLLFVNVDCPLFTSEICCRNVLSKVFTAWYT